MTYRTIDAVIGTADLVQQRAIIDRIAGEQRAGDRLRETDAPRRMARQMQDFKMPVTEIDNISFLDDFRDGRNSNAVVGHLSVGIRKGGDQIVIERIAEIVVSTNRGIAQYRRLERAALARLA